MLDGVETLHYMVLKVSCSILQNMKHSWEHEGFLWCYYSTRCIPMYMEKDLLISFGEVVGCEVLASGKCDRSASRFRLGHVRPFVPALTGLDSILIFHLDGDFFIRCGAACNDAAELGRINLSFTNWLMYVSRNFLRSAG